MLSKISLSKSLLSRTSSILGSTAARGVYTDETRPYVFINEHTKVICQGMTGKHVSFCTIAIARTDALNNSTAFEKEIRNGFPCREQR